MTGETAVNNVVEAVQASCRQARQLPGDSVQATALPYPITKSWKATAPHEDKEKAGARTPAFS
jgi:hypothetical protein